ncbi:MAG: efflux RND transporter periplasmic adaptor subunit [Bacteroidales bacterium]|nr:efflux RND transporter periplasmic adaptor subunit [Bacteroidales bacterium]
MKIISLFIKILQKKFMPYLLITVLFLLPVSCNKKQGSGYSVLKGPFRQSVIETGELQAVNASTLSMPRINYIYGYNFKIVGLAEHGKDVHKGDPVINVDPSSVQKYIIEKRESLENEIASANKLKAQLINNLQDLKAQLRNEQASYEIKKLEMQSSAFETPGKRKVIELEFRQSEIKLNKIKRNLELRPKLDSLDYRIQQIKVKQKENELKAAQETLNLMTVYSPLDGIFVIDVNYRTGQPIKVGDEVYLGNPVAKIPDIRTMKVKGIVLENDISKIKPGQNVIVRLDALPSVPFHGQINNLGKVCVEQDNKKVFLTEVLISESDLRLKPGMTVSCEYITYEGEDEFYVPNNCILEENKHFYLFTRKRGKIRKTEVKTGPSNNMYTIVSGDLKSGQALELPENILTSKKSDYAD